MARFQSFMQLRKWTHNEAYCVHQLNPFNYRLSPPVDSRRLWFQISESTDDARADATSKFLVRHTTAELKFEHCLQTLLPINLLKLWIGGFLAYVFSMQFWVKYYIFYGSNHHIFNTRGTKILDEYNFSLPCSIFIPPSSTQTSQIKSLSRSEIFFRQS